MSGLGESVAKGQRDRQVMLQRFGFIPHSVLHLKRGALHKSMYHLAAERAQNMRVSSERRIDATKSSKAREKAEQRRRAGMFGSITEMSGSSNRETVSVMSPELVDFFVRYYSQPGAVYLDPFAGHGIRMQVAALRGLDYYGGDASHEYVRFMHAVLPRLTLADGQHIEVRQGDSRHAEWVPDGIGDFLFTSPPYWDVEFYGPEAEQLGTGHSYDEFLEGLTDVFKAWHPKFKPGAYVCVNVNDLRRDSSFIPYHADVYTVLRRAGYTLVDTWIVEGLIAGLPKAFAVSFNMRRIAPKLHEYVIIARA